MADNSECYHVYILLGQAVYITLRTRPLDLPAFVAWDWLKQVENIGQGILPVAGRLITPMDVD